MNPGTQLTLERLSKVPRKVRMLKPVVWGRIALWSASLVIVVASTLMAWQASSRLRTLQAIGIVKQARVVSKYYGGTGKYSTASTMTVSFENNGRLITEKREAGWVVMDKYWYSPTVPVTIMPGNPGDWELGPVNDEMIGHVKNFWYVVGGIWALIILGLLVALEANVAFERRLLTTGSAVVGTILSSMTVPKRGTKTVYTIPTMHGAVEKISYADNDVTSQYPPGAEIVVLCRGDQNPRALPLAFFSYVELADD